MNRILLVLALLLCGGAQAAPPDVARPEAFAFGGTVAEIQARLAPLVRFQGPHLGEVEIPRVVTPVGPVAVREAGRDVRDPVEVDVVQHDQPVVAGGDHVEHPTGQEVQRDAADLDRGARRLGGRLEHDGTSGDHRATDLGERDRERRGRRGDDGRDLRVGAPGAAAQRRHRLVDVRGPQRDGHAGLGGEEARSVERRAHVGRA